jgi:hypothetical protein
MRSVKAVAALVTLALLVSACGSDDDGAVDEAPDGGGVEVPDRVPDLTGTITVVTPLAPEADDDAGVVGTILVEGDLAPEQGRKISYTVTTDTLVTGTSDGEGVGAFADLAEGQTADTWATGPCAESYPEQCTLEAIRVTG